MSNVAKLLLLIGLGFVVPAHADSGSAGLAGLWNSISSFLAGDSGPSEVVDSPPEDSFAQKLTDENNQLQSQVDAKAIMAGVHPNRDPATATTDSEQNNEYQDALNLTNVRNATFGALACLSAACNNPPDPFQRGTPELLQPFTVGGASK